MQALSFLAVVNGILLLFQISGGFNRVWISSMHGIVLLIGGIFGLMACSIGFLVIGPTVRKISAIGQSLAKNSTPPSFDQLNQLAKLRNHMTRAQRCDFILLFFSLFAMSIVRHL